MYEPLPLEAGRGDGADGPVEGDGDAVARFFEGGLDDVGREEVYAAEVVFFAVFVEDAPSAALGHVFDGGEGVEVGEGCHGAGG